MRASVKGVRNHREAAGAEHSIRAVIGFLAERDCRLDANQFYLAVANSVEVKFLSWKQARMWK